MIGIDIERATRFKNWSEQNLNRVFSKAEICYAKKFKNIYEHLAGFYCVKEAFVKALNNQTLQYNKIEVLHTETGKPYINLNQYVKSIFAQNDIDAADISISHSKGSAIAVVLLSRTKEN